jgi:hypothetical protein
MANCDNWLLFPCSTIAAFKTILPTVPLMPKWTTSPSPLTETCLPLERPFNWNKCRLAQLVKSFATSMRVHSRVHEVKGSKLGAINPHMGFPLWIDKTVAVSKLRLTIEEVWRSWSVQLSYGHLWPIQPMAPNNARGSTTVSAGALVVKSILGAFRSINVPLKLQLSNLQTLLNSQHY